MKEDVEYNPSFKDLVAGTGIFIKEVAIGSVRFFLDPNGFISLFSTIEDKERDRRYKLRRSLMEQGECPSRTLYLMGDSKEDPHVPKV